MDQDKFILDFIENTNRYYLDDDSRLEINSVNKIELKDVVFYRIDRITYKEDAPKKEALENVLSAIRLGGMNFVYLIKGDKSGVSFYYGICRDLIDPINEINMDDLGDLILRPSLESNFRGSIITKLKDDEEQEIINILANMKYMANIDGVPGINEDEENLQGVDRLVDAMLGDEFAFLVIAKTLSYNAINYLEKNTYGFYDQLTPLAKKSTQKGVNHGKTVVDTKAEGDNHSDAKCEQHTESHNFGKSLTKSNTTQTQIDAKNSKTSGENLQHNDGTGSKNTGYTNTHTDGKSSTRTTGTNVNEGDSTTTSYEFSNKEIQDWLKYIDEVVLKRIDYGKGKGIYISTIALFTQKQEELVKLQNTVTSLFSGESGNRVPLRELDMAKKQQWQNALRNFQMPKAHFKQGLCANEIFLRTALSQYVKNDKVFLGNWFSVKELSVIAGLPQKEVVGLSLREEVEFGLNYHNEIEEKNKICLGNLVQSGKILESVPVCLDRNELDKHIFIAGVTGAGKTTTCQKLLLRNDTPFLVIEPAKTEYRILTKKYDDMLIFTLGRDKIAPFRLNPFEMYPHESISSHVDMIMASIESAFDMEAAIPQIIEKSIYECYTDLGWDISDDTNKFFSWDDIGKGAYAFPTLSDLINKAEEVVKTQGFDVRLQNDYIGSIRARLQGLTVGAKGLMLNTRRSLDFRDLVHKRVILELEEIRSGSEKALVMGFILSNLMEAIRAEYQKSKENGEEFKHTTLVEEAHRLLGKYEPGDSLSKKQGIEMFSDMLAEVRKYGESLVIVDQIPGKLTPEVLKNTNTKIVHKIFAQDDKEAIGNTMALTDDQKRFLSFLDKGRTIVFSQGWESSLQVQITQETDTGSKELISEKVIRDLVTNYYCQHYNSGVFPSLKYIDNVPTRDEFEKHLSYRTKLDALIEVYQNRFMKKALAIESDKELIIELEALLSIEKQARYIRDYIYYSDKDESKLNMICTILLNVKNGKFDLSEYNEKLIFGRRIIK